ncbi:hypothetical protein KR52_09570 [Synechococcus sp. KORDI-52]|nr:hypothetical protein KR52_09570 [Synechococcus sp. KORDI-52]
MFLTHLLEKFHQRRPNPGMGETHVIDQHPAEQTQRQRARGCSSERERPVLMDAVPQSDPTTT